MRHLLEEREVHHPGLDEGPGPSDVDSLTPLPGIGVEDINMSVTVHQQEAVGGGGDASGGSGVHDLHVPGLAALQRIGQSLRCILLGE